MHRGFRSLHPVVLFLFILGAFFLLSIEQHPDFLALDDVILGIYLLYLDRGHFFKRWGLSTLLLFLFFFAMNPILNHRGTHVLFFLRENPVMLEAVIRGGMMALTLMGMLVLVGIYQVIMSSEKFLFLFSRFFPQWALLVLLSLRFVPVLRDRLKEIEVVQKIKDRSVSNGRWRSRITSAVHFIQILLTWSLEEAIQTADSMIARGYGIKKRSHYHPFQFRWADFLFLFIWLMLFIINLFGWWLGDSVLSLFPVLETPLLQGREWFFLAFNALYFGLPLILDMKEEWAWRLLRQRT